MNKYHRWTVKEYCAELKEPVGFETSPAGTPASADATVDSSGILVRLGEGYVLLPYDVIEQLRAWRDKTVAGSRGNSLRVVSGPVHDVWLDTGSAHISMCVSNRAHAEKLRGLAFVKAKVKGPEGELLSYLVDDILRPGMKSESVLVVNDRQVYECASR